MPIALRKQILHGGSIARVLGVWKMNTIMKVAVTANLVAASKKPAPARPIKPANKR